MTLHKGIKMTQRLALLILSLVLSLGLVAGCKTPTGPDTEPAEGALEDQAEEADPRADLDELLERADATFAERRDKDQAAEALRLWIEALDSDALEDQERAELHASLARGHYFLGRYHHAIQPDADAAQISAIAAAGKHHAREALRFWAPDLVADLDQRDPAALTYDVVPAEGIDALLGLARTSTLWAQHQSRTEALSVEALIDGIMAHVIQVDPDAHYGAALRYYGTRYLQRPFHQDPEASARVFAAAVDGSPEFAMNRLLRARDLARHMGDRELFESDLQAVLESDTERADTGPENAFARELAEGMLERVEAFFP